MITYIKRRARQVKYLIKKEPIIGLILVGILIFLGLFAYYPIFSILKNSFTDMGGNYVGLHHYKRFIGFSYFRKVIFDTLLITTISTLGAVAVGMIFAYGIVRTDMPGKSIFRATGIMPMITPPFINAFALILLLGRAGVINNFLDMAFGFKFVIYGYKGVILSQIMTSFPLAYLTLQAAFKSLHPAFEDAARDLGAREFKVLGSVTLPMITPAILTATLLVYMINLAAFGAPSFLGKGLSVLAVEMVQQFLGTFDWGLGAVVGIVLLIPSLLLFIFAQTYRRKQTYTSVTGAPAHYEKRSTPNFIKWPVFIVCSLMSVASLSVWVIILLGAFAKTWGVDYSLVLDNFKLIFTTKWSSIWNTMWMASTGALIAGFIGIIIAYVITRKKFPGRKVLDYFATLPYAVPGTVVGLGLVLAFNSGRIILTGTATIIILSFIVRRMPFALRTGRATLQQIDETIEEGSGDLGARWPYTFRRVIFPLLKPAFIGGVTFAFIRASTELTSTIFLVTPRWRLMSVDIYDMVNAGSLATAAALSTVLMALIGLVLIIFWVVTGTSPAEFKM